MFLESIATAVPPHRYTQSQCLDGLRTSPAFGVLKPRSQAMLEKILGNGVYGIATRSFCLPEIAPVVGCGAQELNETFEREAPGLAMAALAPAFVPVMYALQFNEVLCLFQNKPSLCQQQLTDHFTFMRRFGP